MFLFLKLFWQLNSLIKKKNQFVRIKPVFWTPTGPKALKQNPKKTEKPINIAKDKTGQNKTQDPK